MRGSLIYLLLTGLLLPLGVSAQPMAAAESMGPEAMPGDRVVLEIWNEPEMSDTFTINHNGYVALPRLGLTKVAKVPIAMLEDSLRTSFSEYLRNSSVQIQVLRRISVLGEVREPGVYWADLTVGVRDLIATAGGPTPSADPNRVAIIRQGERLRFTRGQHQMFVTDLLSGDQIVVGQKNFLVRNPWAAVSAAFTLITFVRQLGLF